MKKIIVIGACIGLLCMLSACTRTSIPTGYVETAEPVKLMEESELNKKVDTVLDFCSQGEECMKKLSRIADKETWLFNGDKVNMNQVEDFNELYKEVAELTKSFAACGNGTTFPSLKLLFEAGKEYMTNLQTTMDKLNTEIDKKEYETLVKACEPDWEKIYSAGRQAYIDYYTTTGDVEQANVYRRAMEKSTRTPASAFYNNYGYVNRVCAEEDCLEAIAEYGDTAYCEEHAARCEKCWCPIDPGYLYCSDCAKLLKLDKFEKMQEETEAVAEAETEKGTEDKK